MLKMQDSLIVPFNPDASASILKVKIGSRARLTEEIVSELYKANDFYSNRGHRSDLLTDDSKLRSFKDYLGYVGLYERKAYRWLERYIPEENKLLTYEELTDKKKEEAREKLSAEERDRSIIAEYRKTGQKPAGWTPKHDKAVKDTDAHLAKIKEDRAKEDAEREQRAKEYREKQEAATRPYVAPASPMPEPPDDTAHYYRLGKLTEEMLNNASSATTTHTNQRTEWKEKIRLSDGGQEDAFMDALIDYLETLADDNRRLEACNNIVKICRNIAVELQKKSAIAA